MKKCGTKKTKGMSKGGLVKSTGKLDTGISACKDTSKGTK